MTNVQKIKYDLVPPDGGWGWLVLCGSTLVNLLIPGSIKSFGILFVEFIEEFNSSTIEASWIPALCYFLYCSLGPLASYLSMKFSYRSVTIVGGTCASAGMILSSFATTITHLYFTYGILVGIGAGLSFPPGIFIVTSYFRQYRGLANGVAISGSALGSMILPPFLEYLLSNYGVKGAVLIMGGVSLNVWVGALLYHPVKWHMKKLLVFVNEQGDERIIKNGAMVNIIDTTDNNAAIFHEVGNSFAATEVHLSRTYSVSRTSTKSSRSIVSLKDIAASFNSNKLTYPEFTSQSTLASMSTFKTLNSRIKRRCCCSHSEKLDSISDGLNFVKLLKNPLFIIMLLSNATNAISYTNFSILLPSYAISLGFNKSASSYLLSIIALFDLLGRIGGSAISDHLKYDKKHYFIGGILVSGIALAILPVTNSYTLLSVICGIFGLSSGIYIGITAVTMIELLGEDRLELAYAVSLFFSGILQLIGPPICCMLYEYTLSYDIILTILGIILIAGAAVWLFLPCVTTNLPPLANRLS